MSAFESVIEAAKHNVAEIIIAAILLATQSILGLIKSKKPRKDVDENFAKVLNELKSTRDELSELKTGVQYCKSELQFNGGGSTKDITVKNGREVAECKKQIGELVDNVSRIKATQRVRTEHIYNMSGDGILVFEPDGKCTFANEAIQAIFGVSSEAICDEWLLCIATQEEREKLKTSWDFTFSSGISFTRSATIRNKITRKMIPVFITAKPTIDDNDNHLFTLARVRVKQHEA
jgi:PAS domain S-box-containing protein